MHVLWESQGWLTPREVRSHLPEERAVAYTTVMTVLVRLLAKGRVERRREGRAYEYRAVGSREGFAAARMEELLAASVDRTSTLGHFLGGLSPTEREELPKMLEGQ